MSTPALRAATARWARRRRRCIAAGTWHPWADAGPARAHVLAIRDTGMAVADIARHAGVSRGTIDHLLWGSPPLPPAVQIRTESASALMAYWPVLDDYPDGAVIDATGTRRRLRALATLGWPAAEITRRLQDYNPATVERLIRGDQLSTTAATARAVRGLYRHACIGPAEGHGVARWIADRARRRAARRGWYGPLAWDGPAIDTPAATPETDTGQSSPRVAALAEDWAELEGQGYSREHAAERLGVSRDALQAAILRHRARTSDHQTEVA